MQARTRRIALSAVLVAVLVTGGCASRETGGVPGQGGTGETAGSGTPVLMLGRSVMYGWFQHWGWQGEGVLSREGFDLSYGELAVPPDIADSASRLIDKAPPGTIVFFKFCFDDFSGDEGATRQLEDLEGWVQEVVETARSRDMTVVIGNALPKVKGQTTATLTAEHEAFNQWLDEYAADLGSDKVLVFDFYGVLADSSGALRATYATSADDSHPNERAYEALDSRFFALLDDLSR